MEAAFFLVARMFLALVPPTIPAIAGAGEGFKLVLLPKNTLFHARNYPAWEVRDSKQAQL